MVSVREYEYTLSFIVLPTTVIEDHFPFFHTTFTPDEHFTMPSAAPACHFHMSWGPNLILPLSFIPFGARYNVSPNCDPEL